jgi:hypothetical protein
VYDLREARALKIRRVYDKSLPESAAETLEPLMRLMKTMREQHNRPVDIREDMEAEPSASMCCAFMDTLTSMDLLMLSDAVCDGEAASERAPEPAWAGIRKALRAR